MPSAASAEKSTKIELLRFNTPQMRAFHLSWMAFFLCFFAWFGLAPLMTVVRSELQLTGEQVRWCLAGSVAATVFARLLIGWLCDRIGPRLTYSWLLILGSVPVMLVGLADRFETFLLFRLLIGVIGASFVVTQCHTSLMFAPNCVGTANATGAGWGNLGGGVVQFAMPAMFALFVGVLGLSEAWSWRLAMFVAGALCFAMGIAYRWFTQDTPAGNFAELRSRGQLAAKASQKGLFWQACRDYRVWLLAVAYGACFGIELTLDNVDHTYFVDQFGLSLTAAGWAAGAFGMMNLFARALGGYIADWFGKSWSLKGRVTWLFIALFCEGLTLMLFSQCRRIELAIPVMLLTGLFVKMSNGATYSVVPFLNPRALGSVAGIVGAGGNVGAVSAALFLGGMSADWPARFLVLGFGVVMCSLAVLALGPAPKMAPDSDLLESAPIAGGRLTLELEQARA
ncbi:MAG: MFS transporter [Planctomycetota bacterium]|nr:MFS transporter [Planctomycetota bacterium]